ncbi:hypothetical protein HaLaN_07589 [Haematococcus lacustris]|uniref:Uncharacterized protein n=1 Tax=Haematococcus lacustris TaxID=44745 RepID=A0A699Z8W3_HAELA|nr:hypothetical protein HaLaN_07589 [Haematococcus lacustris]
MGSGASAHEGATCLTATAGEGAGMHDGWGVAARGPPNGTFGHSCNGCQWEAAHIYACVGCKTKDGGTQLAAILYADRCQLQAFGVTATDSMPDSGWSSCQGRCGSWGQSLSFMLMLVAPKHQGVHYIVPVLLVRCCQVKLLHPVSVNVYPNISRFMVL